jgi:hypothetical protein
LISQIEGISIRKDDQEEFFNGIGQKQTFRVTYIYVRFTSDSVAKLLLNLTVGRDSFLTGQSAAGARHDGSQQKWSGETVLPVLS